MMHRQLITLSKKTKKMKPAHRLSQEARMFHVALLHAEMERTVHMLFEGEIAILIVKLDQKLYGETERANTCCKYN